MSGEVEINGLTIHDKNDIDYFKFELNEGSFRKYDTIKIVGDQLSGWNKVSLWKDDLSELATGDYRSNNLWDTTENNVNQFRLEGLQTGKYILGINRSQDLDSIGNYSIKFDLPKLNKETNARADDPFEGINGNNTWDKATEISLDRGTNYLVNGSISHPKDEDWYKFRIKEEVSSGSHFVRMQHTLNTGEFLDNGQELIHNIDLELHTLNNEGEVVLVPGGDWNDTLRELKLAEVP